MKYLLAIDQGTTGSTAALINAETFDLVGHKNQEFPQIFPTPGLVEHNLNDIWKSISSTIKKVLDAYNVQSSDIIGIGITNQRETTCAFSNDGSPLSNAIVWQDRRTSNRCEEIKATAEANYLKKLTGLTIDPYFSSTKMEWLLNNNPNVKEAAKNNNLKFGTIDTFILYKLTNGEAFATEASNASRTMLMSLETGTWDQKALDFFKIKKEFLPTIQDSFSEFGKTKGLNFLPDGIPIVGILGDQQSALFGQGAYTKGSSKCTYGTGAFMLVNTGSDITYSQNGLLTTVAYRHQGKICYALEGSCYIAGAAVQWLRDNLKMFSKSSDVEQMALKVKDLEQVKNLLFYPFFTGIGSPHWNSKAKGAIIGLTRDSSQEHIAWAALEGIALSINDLINAFRKDTGMRIDELRVDGGAVENELLLKMQASFSKSKIIRPKIIETTAYGAALAAAVGLKLLDFSKISNFWKEDKNVSPFNEWTSYCHDKQQLWDNNIKKLYF